MLERSQSREQKSERLRARRRRAQHRVSIIFAIFFIVVAGAFVWLTWQPYVRIASFEVAGADQSLAALAMPALAGTYLYIIPRDSTFFVPIHSMRAKILAAHAEIAALSITHESATALRVVATLRSPLATWCGLKETPGLPAYCYYFDAGGYIYAPVDAASSSAITAGPLDTFLLYDPLEGTTQEPLRAQLAHASQLPSVFDFARQVSSLGGEVASITISNDEVTDQLASGASIVYVLGQEQAAFSELASAKSSYNLSDGSLLYIDLRFSGKIYLKKKGQ